MKTLILIIIAILMTFSSGYSQIIWEKTVGLDSVTTYSLAINSSGNIFAGTSEGIFGSTDNGDNWLYLELLNYDISSIFISSNGDILASTIQQGGLLCSTDNGTSWISIGLNTFITSIALNSNGDIFVGTTSVGLYRTTDNGENWVQINQGLTSTNINSIIINSGGDIFAGTVHGGVFRSTDNGENWVQIIQGLTTNYVLSLAINSSGDIFAGTSGSGVFRSTDNGESWVQIIQGLTSEGHWVQSLAINSNEDIFAGTADGVFKNTENGENWVQINQGLTNHDVRSLAIKSNEDIFVGTSGGVFRSVYNSITTFQLTVNVNNGWNMVSIPGLHPTDQNVGTWWPFKEPGSSLFKYASGYQSVPTATPGLGYWMKHAGARTYNTGEEWPAIQIVSHDPIPASAGWNLIGGYEDIVPVAGLTTTPPGLISGPVFGYSGGYSTPSNLEPGYGYWVKLTSAGQIIIPDVLAKRTEPVEYFPQDWGRIILTDAAGVNYILYAVNGEVDLSQYELPPVPPAGMFDIRYSSGRIAEDLSSSSKLIEMNGIVYPITVKVENMSITLKDESGKEINAELEPGEHIKIDSNTISKLLINSSEIVPPIEYALEQNYPNPFNPSTVIEISLPEDVSNVKLSIYNALGEKVAELVNTALAPGKYSFRWDASNVATGMYIYELKTDKFVSMKKMVLIK